LPPSISITTGHPLPPIRTLLLLLPTAGPLLLPLLLALSVPNEYTTSPSAVSVVATLLPPPLPPLLLLLLLWRLRCP
jgi:hypothetical protein